MTKPILTLCGQRILVVDGNTLSAAELSDRLSALGAQVHVVSNAARAVRFVSARSFDVVLVGYAGQELSQELFSALDRRRIPHVLCASTSEFSGSSYERVFSLPLEIAA